jgi:xylan 1,4-beta-xylosidase
VRNPLLPGSNPDPSIVRGPDAYYLVTSSFSFPAGEVELRMELVRPPSGFVPAAAGGGSVRLVAGGTVLAEFDGRYWCFEVARSFTGRVFGLYAADGTVTFTDLHYTGTDDLPQETSA